MLRIPHCLDNQLIDGGKVVRLTRRPTPRKPIGLLEAEVSTFLGSLLKDGIDVVRLKL
jgi:hypothetical protein